MFRAEPLVKIRLHILASEAGDAALELARFGIYSPAQHASAALDETPAAAYREAWQEAEVRTAKLVERCGDSPPPVIPEDAAAPTLGDLEVLNTWLKDIWNSCLTAYEGEARIAEELRHLDAVQETLGRLAHLNVDLAQLLRPDGLLAVNIGSLPATSFKRLGEALAMSGYLAYDFDTISDQVYVVIAGPRERHDEVRGLLAQAGWRELPVPAELRAHPSNARAWLTEERQRIAAQYADDCAVVEQLRGQHRAGLDEARLRIELARPLAAAAVDGVRGHGALASLAGWIPRRQSGELQARLQARFHGHFWLDIEEASKAEAASVPSLVHYPAWLMPFVPLVRSYGVPRYGEFDPTLPFALAYLLLFGAMFGDIGHGAVIALLAALFFRRLGKAAVIGIAAWIVSMLFGVLYGSVFGFEDVIEPLWISPLHDPIRVLAVAVAFGVGFIVFTLLVNIRNRLAEGHLAEGLCGASGLAGLAFYVGASGGIASLAGASIAGGPFWLLALAGIATVAAYIWMESAAGLGERLLVTIIETVEAAIKLFSNTLSFMRVAAFSLNHVALALAVFTLASGLGAGGHWLTIVLGNVVIIVLEGGIVAIQALRLMYFEGFSRFFSADGKEFVPLKLANVK